MKATYPVVTVEAFPSGLMCPQCRRIIQVGQPYHTVPTGMLGDVAYGRVQCVYCP